MRNSIESGVKFQKYSKISKHVGNDKMTRDLDRQKNLKISTYFDNVKDKQACQTIL